MFAGRRRSSSNVRNMQLFYELKQLHPTASDVALNECIASYVESKVGPSRPSAAHFPGQMGRPAQSPAHQAPPLPPDRTPTGRARSPMEKSGGDATDERVETSSPRPAVKSLPARRPSHLDIKRDIDRAFGVFGSDDRKFNIRLSEKCKNVHELLNSELCEKPPPSPSSAKRLAAVKLDRSPVKLDRSPAASPDAAKAEDRLADVQKRLNQADDQRKDAAPSLPPKKETCSTPTQTTDTLVGGSPAGGLNLSLDVSCSTGAPPAGARRTSATRLVPAQPWLGGRGAGASPRSFTSVSLTLRPPGAVAQDPIDITSRNSSLTYSTSSFDSAKGLQSRLEITVGPGGGSVSSVRVRPRSYHDEADLWGQREAVSPAHRAGSLNDLPDAVSQPPVLLKQQSRIERLRIEMQTRKAKLESVKQEIEELEKNRLRLSQQEIEKRLLMEIKHLTWQCKDLESDGEAFYSNIYTGQHGPLTFDLPPPPRRRPPARRAPADGDGPKWNCGMCTFLNHPVLDKCEQCEMPRIVHGRKPGESVAASRSLSLSNAAFYGAGGAVASRSDPSRSAPNVLGLGWKEE